MAGSRGRSSVIEWLMCCHFEQVVGNHCFVLGEVLELGPESVFVDYGFVD
jgi:hypothetical protein